MVGSVVSPPLAGPPSLVCSPRCSKSLAGKDVSVLSVDATVWGLVRVTPERSARQAREINRARH